MAPMTDHEIQEAARLRVWEDNKRVNEERARLMRLCPNGQALDRAHVLTLIGQQWSSNVIYLHARRFVVRGMQAEGYAVPAIAAALNLTNKEVVQISERAPWWDPSAEQLVGVPEHLRARVVGPR